MRHVTVVLGLVVVLAAAAFSPAGIAASKKEPPSPDAVAFAERTGDLLLATLFAALTQEFDETTPENVEEGNLSTGSIGAPFR